MEECNNPAEKGRDVDCYHRHGEELSRECAQEQEFLQQPKKVQEEVNWTWKRQEFQGFSLGIGLGYQKKVFEDIKSVLTAVGCEETLQEFLDGCFGHLMYFIGGYNSGKALHELISHEIILPGAREDELWFHISGTNIRFSPAEYALVTGLHFGSSSFDPLGTHEVPPDGVYSRFCKGYPITIKQLLNRFNSKNVRASAKDYLKVAHILAFYQMALGYFHYWRVDEWVWVLVEDLDSWNRFPWGAYTYQALMHSASLLPTRRKASVRHYDFYGPVWALQIWAYEAIPHLGNMCALATGQVTMPRCLRWSFASTWKLDIIRLFEQELVCFATLEPTDEEQLQLYWLSVQTSRPLGVRFVPRTRLNPLGHAVATISSEKMSSVSVPLQKPCHSSRITSLQEGSSAEPVNPVEVSCLRPKRTSASACSTPLGGSKIGRPQHIPKWDEAFDEARLVDQVSSRVSERLIKPVAEKVMEPVAEMVKQRLIEPVVDQVSSRVVDRLIEPVVEKVIEPVAEMVNQRLIEPVVELLSQQLIPHMKKWVEDLFHQTRRSPPRQKPPRMPSLVREARNQRKMPKLNQNLTVSLPRGATSLSKKKKSRRSPSLSEEASDDVGGTPSSSSNEETSDDEGSESSSGDDRGEVKERCKKKAKYSESSD